MALLHLLRPKSSFQICRLGFSTSRARCCLTLLNGDNDDTPEVKKVAVAGEASITAVEPIVEESSETKSGLFSKAPFIRNEVGTYVGPNKSKTLADIFKAEKDVQTETTTENDEELTDIFLDIAKHRKSESKCLSPSNDLFQSKSESNSQYGDVEEVPPNTESGSLSPLYDLFSSESGSDSQDDNVEEFPPEKCKKDLPKRKKLRYEGGENSSPSNSKRNVLDLKDSCMKSSNDRAAAEVDKTKSLTFTHQPFQNSNERLREDAQKHSFINGLVEYIRTMDEPSSSTNSRSKAGVVKGNPMDANLQRSDATSNKDQRPLEKTHFAREESEENKVLVKFLRGHITKGQILVAFDSCGEILKVEYPYDKGPLFKSACIHFKTREGFKKALEKSGLLLNSGVVIVESATTTEKRSVKTPIPSVNGDPDAPAALVKNPTRTIKIEQLTREISSHDIEEALAFCQSNVSGYFMGSSESVAYVEFETEIGKERALATQSIHVRGKHLVMLRIDSPRTTVVRISARKHLGMKDIISTCKSLGYVTSISMRTPSVIDVKFGLDEWPDMLRILNRLNGMEVNGKRVKAESPPVFPPEVLLALWHDPEERKRLKTTMQALVQKVGPISLIDTRQLAALENVFVGNI